MSLRHYRFRFASNRFDSERHLFSASSQQQTSISLACRFDKVCLFDVNSQQFC